MVFVTGFGQICNNILQFGHLYAWGKEQGISVIALRFCYKYPYFKINSCKHYNWFTYLFAKYGNKLKLIPTIHFLKEADLNEENKNRLLQNKNSFVEGWYLRDYDAFLRHRDEIKDLFSFKEEIKSRVDGLLPVKEKEKIRLGVHIRRGDYIRWMGGNYYYKDEEYIRIIMSFIDLFSDRSVEIVIVSNDLQLNRDIFKEQIQSKIYFVSGNPGEDLYALSTCDYIIGPPSTFSLMAAFYEDANLYWIMDKNAPVTKESFKKFDYLFRHIL